MRRALTEQLIRHEGYRQFPYKDSEGIWTVAIGRNLQDVGVSESEARYLLQQDIAVAWDALQRNHPIVNMLSSVRQDVLTNMCFNMGISRLNGFKKMWAAIDRTDFESAAAEMMDSKWAGQVGGRSEELASQMREG